MTDLAPLVVILVAVALTPLLVDGLGRWVPISPVVVEIALGIVIGPAVLGWARDNALVTVVANLGLAMLMFLAGYEIDLTRLLGPPLRRALVCWAGSLVIGLTVATVLSVTVSLPPVVVGLASTTTAVGVILPMLRDSGDIGRPFGTLVLAAGSVAEIGPVVAVTLVLTSHRPERTTLLLIGFVALAAVGLYLAARPHPPRVARVIGKTMHTSGQFAVRVAVALLIFLVWVAAGLGLEFLLGAFAGGLIYRRFLASRPAEEVEIVTIKLDGIGFGFVIPVFFVVSGMHFDLAALTADGGNLLVLPLMLVVFLATRALPTLLVYRTLLPLRDRWAAAFYLSAQLPLVVVVTGIGVQTGRLDSGVAAAMVGAGMLSVLIYPLVAFRLRRERPTAQADRAGRPG